MIKEQSELWHQKRELTFSKKNRSLVYDIKLNKLTDDLNISKPTVHEHLTILIESGLVKKVNRDNKWAYYELTDKGTEILHPHKMTKMIVLLSSLILSFVFGIVEIYRVVRSVFPGEGLRDVDMISTRIAAIALKLGYA